MRGVGKWHSGSRKEVSIAEMGKVRVEMVSAFAEALGMPGTSQETVPEGEDGGDKSVRALLNRLAARYQCFGETVFDSSTQMLTGKVIIFHNGRNLELWDGLETKLSDGDSLTFVPFIVGG